MDKKGLEFLKTETFAIRVAKKSFNELMEDIIEVLNNQQIPEETKEIFQNLWELLLDMDVRPWNYAEVVEFWSRTLIEKRIKAKPKSFFVELMFKMVDELEKFSA